MPFQRFFEYLGIIHTAQWDYTFFNRNFHMQYKSSNSFLIPPTCISDHPLSSAIVRVNRSIFGAVQRKKLLWVRHVADM